MTEKCMRRTHLPHGALTPHLLHSFLNTKKSLYSQNQPLVPALGKFRSYLSTLVLTLYFHLHLHILKCSNPLFSSQNLASVLSISMLLFSQFNNSNNIRLYLSSLRYFLNLYTATECHCVNFKTFA